MAQENFTDGGQPQRFGSPPSPTAGPPSSYSPSPFFVAALLLIAVCLLSLWFCYWLATRHVEIRTSGTKTYSAVVRPYPERCRGVTEDLYDCLNRPERWAGER
jgi:hypothetical protein